MHLHLPDNMSIQDFLDNYWQKRPLLLRDAIRDHSFSLTPEELAGLACEEEVESRMVLRHGEQDWELRYGPFDEQVFRELPDRDWTLLVQDVDKYLPEVAELLRAFHFIPSWRFDDIMISYAEPGGSVGPHTDTYDVFLIQARGRRRWQIGNRAENPALLPDLPIRVLADFEPEQEWLLEPGDVLYLPPGVAHWGIGEGGDCMTWSVGLRAPSVPEMLGSYAQYLLEQIPEEEHFTDPPLSPQESPAQIRPEALAQAGGQLDAWLHNEDLRLRWFGCFSTEVKEHLFIEPREAEVTAEQLPGLLAEQTWQRHPFSRWAWSLRPEGGLYLFVCGEAFPLPGDCQPAVVQLCDAPWVDAALLLREEDSLLPLLTRLVNENWLEPCHD
ncbi:JmjC domain-containing protein [Thiolapillus sp.]